MIMQEEAPKLQLDDDCRYQEPLRLRICYEVHQRLPRRCSVRNRESSTRFVQLDDGARRAAVLHHNLGVLIGGKRVQLIVHTMLNCGSSVFARSSLTGLAFDIGLGSGQRVRVQAAALRLCSLAPTGAPSQRGALLKDLRAQQLRRAACYPGGDLSVRRLRLGAAGRRNQEALEMTGQEEHHLRQQGQLASRVVHGPFVLHVEAVGTMSAGIRRCVLPTGRRVGWSMCVPARGLLV
mmetsp:Transcript_4206/g.16429  ORF Transcript_4206/g.16429 Transcript_4206/m.16429 type:complete len:236 (-) Transcript_4206:47-754(-)